MLRVEGLGLRNFRFEGLGSRLEGLSVWGLGFRVWGSGFPKGGLVNVALPWGLESVGSRSRLLKKKFARGRKIQKP